MQQKKFSIHLKVFFSFAAILLISILITLLFGNSMMERLYLNNKSNDLSGAYHKIVTMLDKQEQPVTLDNDLWNCLFEIEQDNVQILLFTLEDSQANIHYFTRKSWSPDSAYLPAAPIHIERMNEVRHSFSMPIFFGPNQWIDNASDLGVFQDANLPLLITEKDTKNNNDAYQTLDYYGKYTKGDTSVYIFLRTPKEAITLAAQLAVKYNLYIALVTFLLMTATSYYVSRRITRPIAKINDATDRISKMNFSTPLDISTGDELEELSRNINSMSEKLQDYIYQLQLNQELLEKDLDREARTNRMRQEFIANVSHDFKTPLTLIRAYTETIRNQQMNAEEQLQYCDIILNESERLNHMVTQLLQLSRLESGTVQLELSYFPIEELMRESVHRNQLLIQKKQLQIHWDCEENDHIVEGDYTRIEQVITNLVENTIKYTQAEGDIYFSVHTVDDLCRIAITNTSEPLTEEQLEKLFISFYKTDESRHLEQQSFGLGLAIVKATMELHGQTCTANNTPEGLQIAFTLPLVNIDNDEDAE